MKVHRVGNSLMVAIPHDAARRLDIREGDEVAVLEREFEVVVRPKTTLRKLFDSWEPLDWNGPRPSASEVAEWFRRDRQTH